MEAFSRTMPICLVLWGNTIALCDYLIEKMEIEDWHLAIEDIDEDEEDKEDEQNEGNEGGPGRLL